jgi:SnoaL-like domain
MSDEEAIRSLMGRYAHLVDDGRFDEWGDLFLDDAQLDVAGNVFDGRNAVVDYVRGSYGNGGLTHLFSVPDIVVEGDEARACADFLLVQNDGKPVGAGRVDDVWMRTAGRWRLGRRRISLKN